MPRNEVAQSKHERKSMRYASDLTNAEWVLIEPDMPPPSRMGGLRKWPMREIMNALLYIASTGCQWRFLPRDFHLSQWCRSTSTGRAMRGFLRGSITDCCSVIAKHKVETRSQAPA